MRRFARSREIGIDIGNLAPLSPCLLFALTYAIFDEFHLAFVPGRGSEVTDIGLDLIGVIAALGLIWMVGNERERGARAG